MKAAVYAGGGLVEVVDVPEPLCPAGGLLVQTEACGLCSGELMDWYLDRKAPHTLGHEVCGRIIESNAPAWEVGQRVFVHHHAPCLSCPECTRGAYVHCDTWKTTRLSPGGMAERFAVAPENLKDAFSVGDMDPRDAALIEPIACVVKSLRSAGVWGHPEADAAVVGLGSLGIAHLKLLGPAAIGYDLTAARRDHARARRMNARSPEEAQPASYVFVCPGTEQALRFGLDLLRPGGTLVLFAPLPPSAPIALDLEALYFRDLRLGTSYSCGPDDTRAAHDALVSGRICYQDLVSDFVTIDEIPVAYAKMKAGEILKAMVVF